MIYTFDYLEQAGRLGNQLWQIAAVVSAAKRDEAQPLFNPNWRYRQFFSVSDEYFGPKPRIGRNNFRDFGFKYYQEWTLWNDMEEEIRNLFKPSEISRQRLAVAKNSLMNSLEIGVPTCAVHVRRGDYLVHDHLFPFPGARYYSDAISLVRARRGQDTQFYVFSDDISWCREFFPALDTGASFEYIVGIPTPVEVRQRGGLPDDQWDMFLMSNCDEHIIANSSFSWWGAYLSNNKYVIYPKRWWGPQVPEYKDMWKVFPDGWVGLRS